MNLLDKKHWWFWIILFIITSGASNVLLCGLLKLYDENAWYAKPKNWLLGLLCLIFPFFVMLSVFMIQSLIMAAAKLELKGKEIYLSPYIWILGLIVPIIGWLFLTILLIYLEIGVIIMLHRGNGEIVD